VVHNTAQKVRIIFPLILQAIITAQILTVVGREQVQRKDHSPRIAVRMSQKALQWTMVLATASDWLMAQSAVGSDWSTAQSAVPARPLSSGDEVPQHSPLAAEAEHQLPTVMMAAGFCFYWMS